MPYAQCSRRYPYAFKWPRPLCHFRLPSFQYPSVRTNFAVPIYSDGRIWSTFQQVQQVFVSFQTIVWSTVTSGAMLSPFSVQKTGTTPVLNLPRPSEPKAAEPRQPTARFVAGSRNWESVQSGSNNRPSFPSSQVVELRYLQQLLFPNSASYQVEEGFGDLKN